MIDKVINLLIFDFVCWAYSASGCINTNTTSFYKTGYAVDLGSQIDENRDVVVYDKSGNKAEYLTGSAALTTNKIQLSIVYDDRAPTNLETLVAKVEGVEIRGVLTGDTNTTKFTNNRELPLTTSTNGVPLSLVIVDTSIYGDVRTGTGTLKAFSYSISSDKKYTPTITTYSYSGVKGSEVSDKIILDTSVGSLDEGENLKSTYAKI